MLYWTPFKNVLIMKGMPYSKHGVDRDPRRTFRTSKIFISEERRHYNWYQRSGGQQSTRFLLHLPEAQQIIKNLGLTGNGVINLR